MAGEVMFTDDVARGLKPVMPCGFVRVRRTWSRALANLESTVAVVRNSSSFGMGDDVCVESRVRLSNGRGYGYYRVDGSTTGSRNWWLKQSDAEDERRRIRDEIHDHVQHVVLPWIENRATPHGYLAHCRDDRVPYRLIEAHLALGDDEELLDVLSRGPQAGVPVDHLRRDLYATAAEAALRAYLHLGVAPSQEWATQARVVLASYRGRPPKSDRTMYDSLKAMVDAFGPQAGVHGR